MFLDNAQATQRLSSPNNLANQFSPRQSSAEIVTKHQPGNHKDKLSVVERNIVSFLARSGESQTAVAREFGVTQSAVSHLASPKARTVDRAAIDSKLGEVRDAALDKLMSTLGLLTEDKLSGCKPGELSNIAANMSRVIDKTLPRDSNGQGSNVSITIYAPEPRKEAGYKVVELAG